MQGAFETGAVVGVKLADTFDDVVKLGARNFPVDQDRFPLDVARRWDAPRSRMISSKLS